MPNSSITTISARAHPVSAACPSEKQILRFAQADPSLRAPAARSLRMTGPRSFGEEGNGSSRPFLGQVLPGRIARFDQTGLSRSSPALEFFLAGDGDANVGEFFEVNEAGDSIPAGEPGVAPLFVFFHTPSQVICDTDVHHSG